MSSVDQAVIIPAPPRAPDPPTAAYFNELNRWLDNLQRIVAGVTYARVNGLYLASSFPTSGYGLRAGEVFANAGILTVVRENDIWAGAFAATAELGTVTVTTS